MSLIYAYNALEVLTNEGFEKMRPPAIKALFLLYEVGPLKISEIATITGRDWQSTNVTIRRLSNFGLVVKNGQEIKLSSNIRALLEKAMTPQGAYSEK